jgi:glycosyltransferase involved in cell wall biosynthesis
MDSINISVITSLYRSESFLEQYLTYFSSLVNIRETELVLVHNDATPEELEILERCITGSMHVTHLKVDREGLYASWNRGIVEAKGKYIAIWNVDDIRTPESLLVQKEALENSGAVMCYGDFYGTRKYGTYPEKLYEYGAWEDCQKEALKRHIIGCFPMWRKELHNKTGYFDEQFKLVGDYEFQLRVASGYPLVKANGVLGYYLEYAGHKLSSNRRLQHKERTVVEIRYRMYNKILMHFLPFLLKYKVNHILNFGIWLNVSEIVPKLNSIRPKEILSLLQMPFSYLYWFVKRSLHALHHFISQ